MPKHVLFLLLTLQLAGAASISELQLITEGPTSHLSLVVSPIFPLEPLILTPELLLELSGGQFSLSENLTIHLNVSEVVSLFSIDREANETVFSGTLGVWCGGTYSDCNNCNGMPPGTFKWCNGAYPLWTYYCDNWCYTFSPTPAYEKAQAGAFVKYAGSATITIRGAPETTISLDDSAPIQNTETSAGELLFPSMQPPSTTSLLIRSHSSQIWAAAKQSDYQNYVSSLSAYYSQYASSIESAHSANTNLNNALAALVSNSQGEYLNYYETAPETASYPKIHLKIRADYAGITPPRGKPEIISLSESAQFENGLPYYALELKNIGAAPDQFAATLSCGNATNASIAVLIGPGAQATLKLPANFITTPEICIAFAYVSDLPAFGVSTTKTLLPFKYPCPAEKQCCEASIVYEERACPPEEKFKPEDNFGNGYYYLQNYVCTEFVCAASSETFLRRISGNTPPPSASFSSYSQPTPASYPGTLPSPKPTASPPNPPSEAKNNSTNRAGLPSLAAIKIIQKSIRIDAPGKTTEGYGQISVLADSEPATGTLELISPSLKTREFVLETGAAKVLFNEIGEWTAIYSGESAKIEVMRSEPKEQAPLPKKADASSTTAFLALSASDFPLMESGGLLLLLAFGFAGIRKYSERIRFHKSFENSTVRLEILNSKADLRNLEITDVVPEGTVLSTISNPPSEVTEIIFGKHIKWKKSELRKGQRMLISYTLLSNDASQSLRQAELWADLGENKRIRVLSNAVVE